MTDTTFVDKQTIIEAEWLNAINDSIYGALNGATSPALARTALDVPQDTPELVPQVRVNGAWEPLSTASVASHASAHYAGGADPIDHSQLLNAGGVRHVDHSALYIQAGSGLVGGGSLETTRQISFSYLLEQVLNCGLYRLENLGVPISNNDAATKKYVDDNRASTTSPLNVSGLPTSASGLVSGDVWNNAGVLNIVT